MYLPIFTINNNIGSYLLWSPAITGLFYATHANTSANPQPQTARQNFSPTGKNSAKRRKISIIAKLSRDTRGATPFLNQDHHYTNASTDQYIKYIDTSAHSHPLSNSTPGTFVHNRCNLHLVREQPDCLERSRSAGIPDVCMHKGVKRK